MKNLVMLLMAMMCALTAMPALATNYPHPSYSVNSSNQFVLKADAVGSVGVDFYWDGVLLVHDVSPPFETTVPGVATNGHSFSVTANWIPDGPSTTPWYSPRVPQVASGTDTSCAQIYGSLYCWGKGATYCENAISNSPGLRDVDVPTLVPFLPTKVRALAMHAAGGCIIGNVKLSDGTGDLSCWGKNNAGIIGFTPIDAPYSSVRSLTSGGGYLDVATGDDFACALTAAGGVKCVGEGDHGQMGNGAMTTINTALITVYTTGVVKVAAGGDTVCALKTNGHVECWGRDDRGQVGNGGSPSTAVTVPADIGITGAVDIAVGYRHACAVVASNAVKCWGDNSFGELGTGSQDTSTHVSPLTATQFTGVASISSGRNYNTCVITTAGAMKCLGENSFGQVGGGAFSTYETTATQVSGFSSGVLSAAVGADNNAGFRNGHVFFWGDSTYGQIGNTAASSPQLLPLQSTGL